MKVSVLKKGKRFESSLNKSDKVQTYGQQNDYPQDVMEVVAASVTGGSCVSRYADFLSGKGFANDDSYKILINGEGDTADHLLNYVAKDYATFGGFAIHVNYNANFLISSLHYQPFENVRFELPNESGEILQVAIHPDWGRRNQTIKRFKKMTSNGSTSTTRILNL